MRGSLTEAKKRGTEAKSHGKSESQRQRGGIEGKTKEEREEIAEGGKKWSRTDEK